MASELEVMPLSRWNESILRYFFCRSVVTGFPDVEQFVECGRIDLVLVHERLRAFVEFKYYWKPRRFDPYRGEMRGFKSCPSRENLAEFRACVDQLHGRDDATGLSKYIILVYADRTDGARAGLNYAGHYERYQHPDPIPIRLIECTDSLATTEGVWRAQLYEVGVTQQRELDAAPHRQNRGIGT